MIDMIFPKLDQKEDKFYEKDWKFGLRQVSKKNHA